MFTGIITSVGTLLDRRPSGPGHRLRVRSTWEKPGFELGESIAVAGACMTVIDADDSTFDFEVSPESLARTRLGEVPPGAGLNLERALRVGDRLGGHIVTGHVDGIAVVHEVAPEGAFTRFSVSLPPSLLPLVVEKGSITLDGVSLTVNNTADPLLSCMLVPHTFQHTTLGTLRAGDRVHVEVDILARHVARLLSTQGPPKD